MTSTFIFFHGIAINTANMLTGVIERNLDDATKSRLYITTENSGERHALDVDYDTATSEWAGVWQGVTTTAPSCKCGNEAMFSNRVSTWGTVK